MAANNIHERAVEKARSKRLCLEALARLALSDQLDVWEDIKLTLGPETDDLTNGRKGSVAGKAATILHTLKAHPKASFEDMARKTYPGVELKVAINNVRSQLTLLRHKGLVRNVGFGKWEPT